MFGTEIVDNRCSAIDNCAYDQFDFCKIDLCNPNHFNHMFIAEKKLSQKIRKVIKLNTFNI